MIFSYNSLKQKAPLLTLFIIFIILKIFLIPVKEYIHVDESLTFGLSFYSNFDTAFNGNEESLEEFMLHIYNPPSSIKDMVKKIYKIRNDNRDAPHTNLYYSLINIFSIYSQNTINALIFRGAFLNIFLFSISFFTAFKITGEFTTNNTIRLITVFSAFIPSAALGNSLFIREYQLQETAFLLVAYNIIIWYKFIKRERERESPSHVRLIHPIRIVSL